MKTADKKGFTLVEVMMAVFVTSLVLAGAFSVYIAGQGSWHVTTLELDTSIEASQALQKMVYGVGNQYGLRVAEKDSVNVASSNGGWFISYRVPDGITNRFEYDSLSGIIRHSSHPQSGQWLTIARGVTSSSIARQGPGINVSISYAEERGQFAASNTMRTFVAFRN